MRKGILLLLPALPALASPALNGTYHGELGVVQFDTEQDGRVSGHYQRAGGCGFEPERRIVEGLFEGDVLVGTVTLCQVGQSCHERVYPFLAFFNEKDGTLSADVKLEPGCASPALNGKRLLLQKGEAGDAKAAAESPAKKRVISKHNAELALKAFAAASKAVQAGDYQKAKGEFEVALSFDEKNYLGYFGLGVAEVNLGHTQSALDAYKHSAELKGDFADTWYNMACAYARLGHKKEALENLSKAVGLGFAEPDLMSGDRDLSNLLANDPEFQQLVSKASEAKRRAHANRREGGRTR